MILGVVASKAVEDDLRAMLDLSIEGVGAGVRDGGWASLHHDLA